MPIGTCLDFSSSTSKRRDSHHHRDKDIILGFDVDLSKQPQTQLHFQSNNFSVNQIGERFATYFPLNSNRRQTDF